MELNEAIDRFRGPLVGLFLSWGVPHGEAIELAQESFADAYLTRENCRVDWRDLEDFGRWLRGVARNNFRNWRRSRSRRETKVRLIAPDQLDTVAHETADEDDPRLRKLRQAIERLPTKQREAVMMHYLEETSVRDVAALLVVTEKTVEGRLYQARRALRRMIESSSPGLVGKALLL